MKSLVTAAFQPVTQVINKYPGLLLKIGENRTRDHIDEFNEIPELRLPETKKKKKKKYVISDYEQYCCYREMKFKNFLIRSVIEADRCVLMGTDAYVRVEKILQDRFTDEIFISGRVYLQRRSLFSINEPCLFESQDVGISVCANLSTEIQLYRLSQLNEKCFALPLLSKNENSVKDNEEWVLIRFLH